MSELQFRNFKRKEARHIAIAFKNAVTIEAWKVLAAQLERPGYVIILGEFQLGLIKNSDYNYVLQLERL